MNRHLQFSMIALALVAWGHDSVQAVTELSGDPGPRELLGLYGMDDAYFAALAEDRPWPQEDNEPLLKLLYRVRAWALTDVERFSRRTADLKELIRSPSSQRGQMFQVRGEAVLIRVLRPGRDAAERFELPQYYRCDLLVGEGRQPAVVYAAQVPRRWQSGGPVSDRAGALGMFVRVFQTQPGGPSAPVFVAPRIAWFPAGLLGDLGMDMGLFDDVSPSDSSGARGAAEKSATSDIGRLQLTARDRECFYQLLAAAGKASPERLMEEAEDELRKTGNDRFSVVPLFNDPANQQGRLVLLEGTVRQAIPVRVSDADIVARFGIRQYYQLSLFTEDSQGNPIVFCVRDLPEGMPTGEAGHYAEYVRVAGFFFKTWGYRSRQAPEQGKIKWQMAPLVIGHRPQWQPPAPVQRNELSGAIAAGLLVLAVSGVVLLLWRAHRRDQRSRQEIAQRLAGAPPMSLDVLDNAPAPSPDFRHQDQTGKR